MRLRRTRFGFVITLVTAFTVFIFDGGALAACGSWTRHPTANVDIGDASQFSGVAFKTRRNAWAVGAWSKLKQNGETCCVKTLTAHFDGTSWKRFPSASPGVQFNVAEGSVLMDVDMSRTRAWAVGYYDTGCFACLIAQRSLIERFDGANWVQVPSPNPGPPSAGNGEQYNALYDVEAISDTLAYAVGSYLVPSLSRYFPLIVRWNGTSWTQVASSGIPSPGIRPQLLSIRANSATDLWAVGDYVDIDGIRRPFALHSTNGTSWRMVNAPAAGQGSLLSGVTPVGPNRAVAVGNWQPSVVDAKAFPLIEGGTAAGGLSFVPAPNLPNGGVLADITRFRRPSGTFLYAVGAYATGPSTARVLVVRSTSGQPAWTRMTVPKVADIETYNAVASLSTGDVLAVGTYFDRNFRMRTLVHSFC